MGLQKNSFDQSERMVVPDIEWIGIFVEDNSIFQLPDSAQIPLSESDIKKIAQLCEKPWVKENYRWLTQLQLIESCGHKMEIQCMASINPRFLCDHYLPKKLQEIRDRFS